MPRPYRRRSGSIDIEVDTSGINRILRELGPNATRALKKAAFMIESRAKQKAPVDTGALRNSIYTRIGKGADITTVGIEGRTPLPEPDGDLVAHIGPSVHYAVYVEMGTHRMSAQPYLLPAVRETEAELAEIFRGVINA